MDKEDFKEFLDDCIKCKDSPYRAYMVVGIHIEGMEKPEIIVNPPSNFEYKRDYYLENYSENLTLLSNPNIRIIGWGSGETFEEAKFMACLDDE